MAKSRGNGHARPLKQYKTYRFKQHDPQLLELLSFMADEEITLAGMSRESGVASGTLGNWRKRKVRSPRNETLEAAGRAIGKKRVWVDV